MLLLISIVGDYQVANIKHDRNIAVMYQVIRTPLDLQNRTAAACR